MGRDLLWVAREAIAGGATALQLHIKGAAGREYLSRARELLEVARSGGVPLIINDRPDIAAAAGADGVHLGQDDFPVGPARALLGPGPVIGASCDTAEETLAAAREEADYVGVGPVFSTASKQDAGPVMGLDGFAAVAMRALLPVVAIGGISPANAGAAVRAGAAGVAVISCVCAAQDVRAACGELREAVERARAAG
ncbi:MAG: thiamine-phosphate diphosphorylase [Firmicutes bacterium RBG_13_65_8]|nr:MAG: thiamine-phosphate diphosphorylase [Firmicutes bacterium RBG_13_65_8]